MITIVDYGVGNLRAFTNIYKSLGIAVTIAQNKQILSEATKIILPGVGAFDYAMRLLQQSDMVQVLQQKVIQQQTPVLGVCVGMQLLAQSSEEGQMAGLHFIENAQVKKFKLDENDQLQRIPQMGWNTISCKSNNPLFNGISSGEQFYFLHSYYFACDVQYAIANTQFYQHNYVSAVQHNHIFGVQFHPEKSHQAGIQLLKNFATL